MDIFIKLLDVFKPDPIYGKISEVASFYLMWAVPIFFAASLSLRYLEESTASIGEGTSMANAVKDTLVSIMWIGLYASFGVLVMQFHAAMCALFYSEAGLKMVISQYQGFLKAADLVKADNAVIEFGFNVINLLDFGQEAISQLLFYFSFLLMICLYIFLRLGYAICFSMVYIWGLVVVPTMTSKHLNTKNGWVRSVMAIMFWPLVEATIFMLIIPIFHGWSESVLPKHSAEKAISRSNMYLIFFVCNMVMSAISVAAPMLSIKIANNENMASGLVAPFTGAAAATALMISRQSKALGKKVGTPAIKLMGGMAGKGFQNSAGSAFSLIKRGVTNLQGGDGAAGGSGLKDESPLSSLNPNNRGPGK